MTTKPSTLQKKYYVLTDNIYLRAVHMEDLRRVDQIASVVNSAFVTDGNIYRLIKTTSFLICI